MTGEPSSGGPATQISLLYLHPCGTVLSLWNKTFYSTMRFSLKGKIFRERKWLYQWHLAGQCLQPDLGFLFLIFFSRGTGGSGRTQFEYLVCHSTAGCSGQALHSFNFFFEKSRKAFLPPYCHMEQHLNSTWRALQIPLLINCWFPSLSCRQASIFACSLCSGSEPRAGVMLCCRVLMIWMRVSAFSFCTNPCRWCSEFCLQTSFSLLTILPEAVLSLPSICPLRILSFFGGTWLTSFAGYSWK